MLMICTTVKKIHETGALFSGSDGFESIVNVISWNFKPNIDIINSLY